MAGKKPALMIVIGPPPKGKMAGKSAQYSPKADADYDKAHGIKAGSAKDNALDKKRGVMPKKGKGK